MIRPILPALLLASAAVPSLAGAQATVQALPGTTDADLLAAQMRLLAANPNDLNALLAAGELSLKLEDLGAAASFFARAEKIDPRNGRVKAGQGAILVHAERPGEALRYFAAAEADGLPAAAFASDRGLAYDLIGEQERAQRDYRLALRTGPPTAPDPETLRRYALSLGISGKRDLAEQQLQPLLKKQDRGAWRARAFIEAMTGNGAEASHIATTMMPPGTAAGLQPFFERLPTLGPVDRAFAVHFGEVRGTPQRLADARQAPPLPALGADPYAPRAVALAAAAPATEGKRRRERRGRQPVEVAAATPLPQPVARASAGGVAAAPAVATPRAVAAAAAMPPVPGVMPAFRPASTPPAVATMPGVASAAAERDVTVAPAPARIAAVAPPPVRVVVAAPAPAVAMALPVASSAVVAPAATSAPGATTPVAPVALAASQGTPVATAGIATVQPLAVASPTTTNEPSSAVAAVVPPVRHGSTALADIVGHLSIPAAELGVAGPKRPVAEASPEPAAAEDARAAELAAAERAASERAAAAKALADKRVADRKAAADRKALAEKKAAAEQKAEEAREAAAQRKLERANPERIWVQVAGGAYEGDLPKAWAAAKKKGGDLFAGHATGWTTPLRFTNRVLAGPFKTDEDARAFVNKLKTKGMSGFTFTSEPGQVVKKLDAE